MGLAGGDAEDLARPMGGGDAGARQGEGAGGDQQLRVEGVGMLRDGMAGPEAAGLVEALCFEDGSEIGLVHAGHPLYQIPLIRTDAPNRAVRWT